MPATTNNKKRLVLALVIASGFSAGCQTTVNDAGEHKLFSLVYSKMETNGRSIYLSDKDGTNQIKVVDITAGDGYPAISPTGKQLAFYGKYDDYKTWSIHTVDIDGTNVRRLTHVKNVWDSAPVFSSDGRKIIFAREYKDDTQNWHEEIWTMDADGTNQSQITALQGRSPELMPDGRILFQSKASPSQICIANADGSNIIILTDDDTNNMSPKLSPDGKHIAYLSNRDGNQEVYLMNIDGTEQKRLTKNSIEEWDPAWSPDGKKVYFSSDSTFGFLDIFKVNKDGTAMQKVLDSGSQANVVHHLDQNALQRLLEKQKD